MTDPETAATGRPTMVAAAGNAPPPGSEVGGAGAPRRRAVLLGAAGALPAALVARAGVAAAGGGPAGTGAPARPGAAAGAPGLKPVDPGALQTLVTTTARELFVPGALVLLRTPQGELAVAAGTTQLGAAIPPRADTYFRIASNTKTMTAALIMQLAQEGKLRLNDTVARYVPGVPDGDGITLAQLLEMRSGLYNFTEAPEFAARLDRDPARAWTPAEVLAVAFAHPPTGAPGTDYEYSNTNYVLLGLVVERVDGRPLAAALHDRLFRPLGLARTALPAATSNTLPEPYAHGYLYGGTSVALTHTPPYTPELQAAVQAGAVQPTDFTGLNHSWATATGGVVSTASDLATWIGTLITGGVLNGAYQRLWLDAVRPEYPSQPDGPRYGYGVAQLRWGPNAVYFHGGETAGYNSFMGHDLANGMTLVVWANLPVAPDVRMTTTANELAVRVLDQIYAVSPRPTPPAAA
jgi:D-alanyl-D-alanine carboxypeptidase